MFVGINGVGKSTSLSKVAYFLSNQNFKVKIAACDTFRSGAVEQLEKHGHRLGIEVFSQGYAKNPSAVAGAALSDAKRTCLLSLSLFLSLSLSILSLNDVHAYIYIYSLQQVPIQM